MASVSLSTSLGQGVTVKASMHGELRRFSLALASSSSPMATLVAAVTQVFSLPPTSSLLLKYKDSEGDLVTMSHDNDVVEAVAACADSKPPLLRLLVDVAPTLPASTGASPPKPASLSSSSSSPLSSSGAPSSAARTVLYNGKPYVPQGTYTPDPTVIDPKKSPSIAPSPTPASASPSSLSSPSPSISPSSSTPQAPSNDRTVAALSASTAAMVRALSASTSRDTVLHADRSAQSTLEFSSAQLQKSNVDSAYATSMAEQRSDQAQAVARAKELSDLSDKTRDSSQALSLATALLVDPLAQSTREAQSRASDKVRDQLQRDVEDLKALLANTNV